MERINGVRQPLVFAAASVRNYVHRVVKGGVLKQSKGEIADESAGGDDCSSDGGLEMYRDFQREGPVNTGSQPYQNQQRSGSSFGQSTQLLHLDAVAEGGLGFTRTQERSKASSPPSSNPFYSNIAPVDYIPLPTVASQLPPEKNLQLNTYGKTAAEAEAVLQETMDFSDPLHAAVLVSEFTNQVITTYLPLNAVHPNSRDYICSRLVSKLTFQPSIHHPIFS